MWHPAPGTVAGALPRSSGFGNSIPDTVLTARVIFDSTVLHCCLAFDPRDPAFSQQRLLVLDQLPVGSATVMLAGFPTAHLAPGDDDRDSTTCITDPPNVGFACRGIGATASYRSVPKGVTVALSSPSRRHDAEHQIVAALYKELIPHLRLVGAYFGTLDRDSVLAS